MRLVYWGFGVFVALAAGLFAYSLTHAPESTAPRHYTCEIIAEYPHDSAAFTQGLLFADGFLYESTGMYGASSLRQVELESGHVVRQKDLAQEFFGEGLALVGERLIQLTWKEQAAFIYRRDTFEPDGQFSYTGEAWGLAFDGSHLVMSDGTEVLRFRDPDTFAEIRQVRVEDDGIPVRRLNELEYVRGEIYANIWQTDRIARIDPDSGRLLGWVDLTALRAALANSEPVDVLNGIAYDPDGDRLFVTGKRWPKLFEIRLTPAP